MKPLFRTTTIAIKKNNEAAVENNDIFLVVAYVAQTH